MLIAAFITLFIASILLIWQGALPLSVGLLIAGFSLGGILRKVIRRWQVLRSVANETRVRKAKWGGELLVVTGLSSVIGMHCRLFITRKDALILDDGTFERLIHLEDIERIGLFYGEAVERLNDVRLGKRLKTEGTPHFSAVRAWLSVNPGARNKLMLTVIFSKPINDLVYSKMVVFSDLKETGNLKAFASRPEIAVKSVFIPHGRKDRRKQPPKRAARRVASPTVADTGARRHEGRS